MYTYRAPESSVWYLCNLQMLVSDITQMGLTPLNTLDWWEVWARLLRRSQLRGMQSCLVTVAPATPTLLLSALLVACTYSFYTVFFHHTCTKLIHSRVLHSLLKVHV